MNTTKITKTFEEVDVSSIKESLYGWTRDDAYDEPLDFRDVRFAMRHFKAFFDKYFPEVEFDGEEDDLDM